ncbi:putative transcription factor TFIIA complex subunit Toa1 [Paecilomyces variotii]|uniref:Transcription initiation factor IIA large subunit n=1 Tax=Byssochlamys spectabilis TaxID=264951 RepID=A0A443HK62_BYSSP|nr:putative transcription factor TFIIA complex subunit Toa1 [Paecilomyces variotii]RWQ92233.1 putative transcription factor TFIIA complex subunit Toa1 [Paecilomyces variotii]
MSNQQVGMVFDRVIQEVCEASRVDFEESGVDQQTLEELRKSWQQKLSSLGVAHFPWDPPPQPAPQPQNPILPPTATVPSNAPKPPSTQQPQAPQQQIPQSHPGVTPSLQAPVPGQLPVSGPPSNANGQPRIKTEPGLNGPMNQMPQAPSNPQSARERAANMLQQRYGPAATTSISQLQAQSQAALSLPGQPRPANPQMPNGQGQDIKPQQYQNVNQPQSTPVGNAQTDGASDGLMEWKAEVARRREAAARQNGEGDRLLREQLRLQALSLEGGGLMLPLDEQDLSSKIAKRRVLSHSMRSTSEDIVPGATPTMAPSISSLPRPQYDGPDDDDKVEDDEDAINSDLDDPDDLIAEEHEGEDAVGQVMLCTYDKVQRVKNKWKCTLKDGILTTGGKEYVFHKGQGEFEW